MSWPTMSDYQEAIQNPSLCFSDPQLKAGTPTLNALGLPQPVTGGFCSVYQVTSGKTRWAVRCFLHNIKDLRDRYHQISKYLRWSRPKQMVGFEYLPEGIRIRQEWNPVLKMEWVEGDTLNVWVDKHNNDARALRKLDDQLVEVMDSLEKSRIGHCDLQHGNILVNSSGQLRLIDYDGMYVPPLRGRGSHEKGHPAYQHPQREGKDFDEKVDRFSALVIHTSLIALAESQELWRRYYDEDNLIFRRADFQNPDAAPVFQELAGMGGMVAEHAGVLRDACLRRVDQAPRLRELRQGKVKAPEGRMAQIIPLPVSPRSNGKPAKSVNVSTAAAAASAVAGAIKSVVRGTPPAGSRPASAPAAAPKAAPAPAPRAASATAAAPSAAFSAQPAPRPAPAKAPAAKPAPKPAAQKHPAPKHAAPKHAAAPAKPSAAPAAKPSGTQPAWLVSTPAQASAPTAASPQRPPAPRPAPPSPPARVASQSVTASASPPARVASQPATTSAPAGSPSGWLVEWMRPGELNEQHVWKIPVYGTREVPRMFLGIAFGTKQEKFAESFEEKVEDRGYPLGGHRSAITALAFTSDSRFLASSSRDGTVRVWNVQSGREGYAPLEARSGVVAMTLVPDRPMLVAALEDRRLLIWDYGLHRRVIHLEAPDRSPLRAVAVSHDGRYVAAGGDRRRIYVWQTDGGSLVGEIHGTTGRVESLAFTPDARGIVCGTHKARLELYDRDSGDERWSVRTGCGRIRVLATSQRLGGVLGGAAEGTVARWDLSDGSETHRARPMTERLVSLAVSPDAASLLVGSPSGKAYLSDMASNREIALLDDHGGPVTASALPGSGRNAATGAADGTVRLWGVR